MNDNRLLNMLTIRIYISLMITIFTSIYDKVITSSPVRGSENPWFMQKDHLIHRFSGKNRIPNNTKINSITVHGETIPVVPMSIAFLIDPELSSEYADEKQFQEMLMQ
ncbi:unnamed protein product [Heterobilharzia americana]|nr:unnamed protein product [Heterobilharzia americana]